MGVFSFVRDEDIGRSHGHKFTSAGPTPLDKLMDPFWQALARRLPRCISPNVISLVGGACAAAASVSSVVATRFESPSLYFVAPALLFIYMTLDAVDGLHARMTDQCSPLGAIVDHGIDAFIAFTTGVAVCITVDPKLSSARIMLAYCLFHSSWFCAQWAEMELGALDQRGITEGEFITMFLLSLPGLVSRDIFAWESPELPGIGAVPLQQVIEYGVIIGCGAVSIVCAVKIFVASSGRRLHACLPFAHMCLHNVVSVMLFGTSFGRQSSLFTFLVVGMNAATLMTKVRLAATCGSVWPVVHLEMLPFFIVAVMHIAGVELGLGAFSMVLAWQCIYLVMMWHDTISRICRVLDIPFLAEVPGKKH